MHEELDVCFPNVFRTHRMFIECFPNTSRIQLQATFRRSMKITQHIFGATECRSVCIRTEPNSQYAPRIHRMLPEYGPFAPRTPTLIFGTHSEWHSAQCTRAITLYSCTLLSGYGALCRYSRMCQYVIVMIVCVCEVTGARYTIFW
jgi:hypothetical protein